MNLTLNIYDKTGKSIVRTAESDTFDLMFGTVMSLMELLKIEDMDDQLELLKTVSGAYSEITNVLTAVFPDVTETEWKFVKVKELMPIIIDIAKFAVSETFVIPKNPKN